MKEIARKKGSLLITEGLSPSSYFAYIDVSRLSSICFFISECLKSGLTTFLDARVSGGGKLATGNPPLPFHRIPPLLSISLSLVSAFFKSLAAVDDDGAEKIKLTERLKDFLISRQRVSYEDSDQSSYPQLDRRLLVHLHEDPRSEAVRKSFVHPQRRDQVARQSMSWCQITPSRPIEHARLTKSPMSLDSAHRERCYRDSGSISINSITSIRPQ